LRELMTAFGEVEDHRIPPLARRCCSCWWPGFGSSRTRSPASTDG
jgi:hypothetical protein